MAAHMVPYHSKLNHVSISNPQDPFWGILEFSPIINAIFEHTTMNIYFESTDIRNHADMGGILGKYMGIGLIVEPGSKKFNYGNVTDAIQKHRGSRPALWHGSGRGSVSLTDDGSYCEVATQSSTSDVIYYKTYLRGKKDDTIPLTNYAVICHDMFTPFNDYVALVLALIATLPLEGRTAALTALQTRQQEKNRKYEDALRRAALARSQRIADEAEKAEKRAARKVRKLAKLGQSTVVVDSPEADEGGDANIQPDDGEEIEGGDGARNDGLGAAQAIA